MTGAVLSSQDAFLILRGNKTLALRMHRHCENAQGIAGFLAGRRFMNALQLVTHAASLGDAESLAQHPASMTHSFCTPEERAAHMISEGLVRIPAGLEDLDDLLADVDRVLRAA